MRFSFAPLALIVPGAFSQNTTSEPVPHSSRIPIPKTWDECIGAGIAEIWAAHKERDTAIGGMSPCDFRANHELFNRQNAVHPRPLQVRPRSKDRARGIRDHILR